MVLLFVRCSTFTDEVSGSSNPFETLRKVKSIFLCALIKGACDSVARAREARPTGDWQAERLDEVLLPAVLVSRKSDIRVISMNTMLVLLRLR